MSVIVRALLAGECWVYSGVKDRVIVLASGTPTRVLVAADEVPVYEAPVAARVAT